MGFYVAVFLTFHYGHAQIPNQRPETTPARRIGNPWAKDGLDVRDFGVDCTFARDSSAALNAIYANEATMLLPFLEQIRCLVSTRTIANFISVRPAGRSIVDSAGVSDASRFLQRIS